MSEGSHAETLKRLQQDYIRGALSGEEYARLREQVMTGRMAPAEAQEQTRGRPSLYVAPGADPVTDARLASWGRRAAAYFIDLVLLVASFVPTGVWAISSEDPVTGEVSDASAVTLGLQILFLPALYSWLMLGLWGATLGKMAVGVLVRRGDDAAPIGLARALGRVASLFLLGILTIPALLSYLWPLWDSRNQALHDKMANTIVVSR